MPTTTTLMNSGQLVASHKTAAGTVSSLSLSQIVKSLADNVQNCMTAQFNLQTALINLRLQNQISISLSKDLEGNRVLFRDDWNQIVSILQRCHGYMEDYISLCEFAVSESPSDCLSFARDILKTAKSIVTEVGEAKLRNDRLAQGLHSHKSKLTSVMPVSNINDGKWGAEKDSTLAYLLITHETLHPDGLKSVAESFSALERIGRSLTDLQTFWEDHTLTLSTCTSRRTSEFSTTREELLKSGPTWRRYQPALLSSISSISSSSDAVMVGAVGAPSPTLTTPKQSIPALRHERSSLWNLICCC